MTEEFWANYKGKKDAIQTNQLWKNISEGRRREVIKESHPDALYAICRTDNNYWRHYRASPKIGIDELSMMICREVGCDLSYCQNLMWKPKSPSQNISDCLDEYNSFRNCVVREKKIFRSMVGDIDLKKNPSAITDYLEKHFKQKEQMKKQKQMMGNDEEELRNRIQRVEDEKKMLPKKKIDTMEFKSKREIVMGEDKNEKYI